MSQTDWLVLGVGGVIIWGLVYLSRQIENLGERLAPSDDFVVGFTDGEFWTGFEDSLGIVQKIPPPSGRVRHVHRWEYVIR